MTEKYRDAAPRGQNFYREAKQKAPLALNILIWVITGIILSIILTNVKPYEIIASRYLSGVSYSEITEFILGIWVIGAIFGFLLRFVNFGLGFLLWAFIQILEIIPMELLSHERFLDKNIQKAGKSPYTDSERDSWEVKLAKKIRNSLSTEVLRFLIVLGVCVYVIDFFACLTVFPPVQGGGDVWKLLEVIQYQQFSQIDWGNILRAVTTVGAVQFLLKLRRIIVQIIRDLND
ncbi:hypothetical protein IQ247_13795 [Plectonema cf. radiosum LEGE 06105]|uniref:Uncharacterized protein n=1 Tax=Plectonema cf. radiosum LEGE 06105 TaxID=945769 RepID=A0A8J7F506_9CYAN|nr:hypothetical protein [Plectonema radiosum]MBE9213725.1 hypothetical protein [Plectonema cf. radiosum LEGE 06105]